MQVRYGVLVHRQCIYQCQLDIVQGLCFTLKVLKRQAVHQLVCMMLQYVKIINVEPGYAALTRLLRDVAGLTRYISG
jgi:hypothetical protein